MVRYFVMVVAFWLCATGAMAQDRHSGYYYPEPLTSEDYISRLAPLDDVSKRSRAGFTAGLNARQQKRAYPPQYHIFAKGASAQKMIIVASGPGHYDTIYRLRALLAALTSEARLSPIFQSSQTPEDLNFLDLAKLSGFTQITISDGHILAHRINLL